MFVYISEVFVSHYFLLCVTAVLLCMQLSLNSPPPPNSPSQLNCPIFLVHITIDTLFSSQDVPPEDVKQSIILFHLSSGM